MFPIPARVGTVPPLYQFELPVLVARATSTTSTFSFVDGFVRNSRVQIETFLVAATAPTTRVAFYVLERLY